MPVYVEGLAEASRAFAKTDREIRLGWRHMWRDVAEPVRRDAETLALEAIPNMARSPKWARMLTGVTRHLVYVVPRQKGWHGRNPHRRQAEAIAGLLRDRALQPALDRHEHQIEHAVEHLLDRAADDFNRGAP